MSQNDQDASLQAIQSLILNTSEELQFSNQSNRTEESECYYVGHNWLGEKLVLISIVGTVIAVLGIMGNMTTALILTRPSMRSPNNLYLTALAVFDTCLLVTAILIYSLEYIIEYTSNFELYVAWLTYLRFCYALSHIAQTGSVYTTVAVTIERYLAVVHPVRGRALCNKRGAGGSILVVTIFAILFNCTKFFELEIRRQAGCEDFKAYSLGTGPLVTMSYHFIYSLWMSNVVMVFFPFLMLLLFNSVIAWTIRKSLNRLAWASSRLGDRRNELKEKSRDATRVLVVIVLIFLICNLWGFVLTLMESIYGGRHLSMKYKKFYTFSRESVNFLAIVNSSINFIIYLIFGKDFRKELVVVYGCKLNIPMLMPPEDKFTALEGIRSRISTKPVLRQGGIRKRKSKDGSPLKRHHLMCIETAPMTDDMTATSAKSSQSDEESPEHKINPNIYGRPDYIPAHLRGKYLGNMQKLRRAASTYVCRPKLETAGLVLSNGSAGTGQSLSYNPSPTDSTADTNFDARSGHFDARSGHLDTRFLCPQQNHWPPDEQNPLTASLKPPGYRFSGGGQNSPPQVQLTILNETVVGDNSPSQSYSSSEDTTIWL